MPEPSVSVAGAAAAVADGWSGTHYESECIYHLLRSRERQDPVHPSISYATVSSMSTEQFPHRDFVPRAGRVSGSSTLAVDIRRPHCTVVVIVTTVDIKTPIDCHGIGLITTCDIYKYDHQ